MIAKAHSLFRRQPLDREIALAAKEGTRLVLAGRPGSGRWTAIQAAIPKTKIITWDLQYLSRESQLEALPRLSGLTQGLQAALDKLDRDSRKSPLVLVLRNIDGACGVDGESAIMGRLRSELQSVQRLRVFYTAHDRQFLGRHFGSSTGAFFKQAVLLDIPDLSDTEIELWAHRHAQWTIDPAAIRALIAGAGSRAGDVALVFNVLMKTRERISGPIGVAEVQQAIANIIEHRRGSYADLCVNHLSAVQRSVLRAIACGLSAKGSVEMVEATGIPKGPLSSTLNNLRAAGWLHSDTNGRLVFADSFLCGYLAQSTGKP